MFYTQGIDPIDTNKGGVAKMYVIDPPLENLTEKLLTKMNELYLAHKISAVRYTKLEKLIFGSDKEDLVLVAAILESI